MFGLAALSFGAGVGVAALVAAWWTRRAPPSRSVVRRGVLELRCSHLVQPHPHTDEDGITWLTSIAQLAAVMSWVGGGGGGGGDSTPPSTTLTHRPPASLWRRRRRGGGGGTSDTSDMDTPPRLPRHGALVAIMPPSHTTASLATRAHVCAILRALLAILSKRSVRVYAVDEQHVWWQRRVDATDAAGKEGAGGPRFVYVAYGMHATHAAEWDMLLGTPLPPSDEEACTEHEDAHGLLTFINTAADYARIMPTPPDFVCDARARWLPSVWGGGGGARACA